MCIFSWGELSDLCSIHSANLMQRPTTATDGTPHSS